jgi:hypothetical protein
MRQYQHVLVTALAPKAAYELAVIDVRLRSQTRPESDLCFLGKGGGQRY